MDGTATRRTFLGATGAAALGALAGGCRPADRTPARRPNLVFILADDLGYGDIACYGAPDTRTPAVDGLAAEGVRFTQAYAAGPECTPTRTAFLTGRYLQRVGGLECAIGTGNVGRYDDAVRLAGSRDLGLPPEPGSLARSLKGAGYATAVYGKWHLGYERKFLPRHHGFDHFVGVLGGNCDYFHHCEVDGTPVLYEDDRPTRRDAYFTDLVTEESVRFLRRQRPGRPFFLYAAYTAPHSPYQGPGDRRPAPVSAEEWARGTHEKYVEMVEHMDRGIGRILETLRASGAADRTLVVFTSDNGANKTGRNAPFSGFKGGLYEGGIRVPCVVRWPGVLPAGVTRPEPCITMDLTASLVAAGGAAPPAGRPMDGLDVLGRVARGEPAGPRTLFWRARRGERTWRAARDADLKYLSLADGPKAEEHLFDLASDPAEQSDLLAGRPADAARLRALLAEWEREVRPAR